MNYLMFIAASLAPAMLLAIIEKPGRRVATVSVGSLTLAALIPLIGDAMLKSGREDPLHSSFAWSTVGLAILLGGLIYIMLPVATSWFDDRDKRLLRRRIRDRQKELEETWGSDVKT